MRFQETLKVLSDLTRRETVNLLKGDKRSVGDIVLHFSSANVMVSHHLSILRKVGLVTDEKQGKYVYYELNTGAIDEIVD